MGQQTERIYVNLEILFPLEYISNWFSNNYNILYVTLQKDTKILTLTLYSLIILYDVTVYLMFS